MPAGRPRPAGERLMIVPVGRPQACEVVDPVGRGEAVHLGVYMESCSADPANDRSRALSGSPDSAHDLVQDALIRLE